MVKGLNLITSNRYLDLYPALDRIFIPLGAELRGRLILSGEMPLVIPLAEAPQDRPELIGGKANNLAVTIQNLQPAGAGRLHHHHPGLPALPGAQPPGGAHPRPGWRPGWRASTTNARPPARSSTASWRGWCPRKWPRRSRRQAEKGGGDWAVRSSAYGEDGELSFAGLHESLLQRSGPGRHQGL